MKQEVSNLRLANMVREALIDALNELNTQNISIFITFL